MADSDRLATELSALRTTLRVRPPGVEAVARTVARRRRRRRVAVVVTALVALVAISSAAFGLPTVPDRPDVSTSQSPSPTPSGPPSTAPTGAVAGTQSPSAGSAGSAGGLRPTGCWSDLGMGLWEHDSYLSDVELSIYPEQLCPNQRIEAAWAAYSIDSSGVQHLEGSQTVILDAVTPTAHVSVVLPQACSYKIYFLQNAIIPTTIAANANLIDSIPFRRNGAVPSRISSRFAGSNCESMPTVAPHDVLV